jgi:hypothetical protein
MTRPDGIALLTITFLVFGMTYLRDRLFQYLIRRPSLKTRMYLQSRKRRKEGLK